MSDTLKAVSLIAIVAFSAPQAFAQKMIVCSPDGSATVWGTQAVSQEEIDRICSAPSLPVCVGVDVCRIKTPTAENAPVTAHDVTLYPHVDAPTPGHDVMIGRSVDAH